MIGLRAACAGSIGALPAINASAAGTRERRTILVVGDSLSAEYGLPRGSGWVALMEARLAKQTPSFFIVNASISGDTTAGGRSRLPALLAQHRPSHVVIELGANDALRGLPLNITESNLKAMVQASRSAGAAVLLVGMQVPPNYGTAYSRDFANLFPRLAQREGAALVPFLLAGVADADDPLQWFQADRIHPNAAAHPRILDNVWSVAANWLKR